MVRASGHQSWLAFKKEVNLGSDSGLVVLQSAVFLLRIFPDLTEILCFIMESRFAPALIPQQVSPKPFCLWDWITFKCMILKIAEWEFHLNKIKR